MDDANGTRDEFTHHPIVPALLGLIEPQKVELRPNGAVAVQGRLLADPATVYRPLRERCERLGFTPFLLDRDDGVEVLAVPGVTERRPLRWGLNLALFLATVFTVLLTGAASAVSSQLVASGLTVDQAGAQVYGRIVAQPLLLLAGLPFAATLLGILAAHEMGHFVVSRWRGAPASLPYFIPLPPGFSFTGTLGAVIVQREPFEDRRVLLEVAIAGPLAGLFLAIPLLFYGLATSTVGPPPGGMYLQEGNSLLYAAAKYLVFGEWLPAAGRDVQLNDIAFGAWIGLLVTMLNLLPVGQLDGGHVAYAMLGRRAEYLAYATLLLFLVLGLLGVFGIFGSSSWLVWVILIGLMGPRHPPPLNDVLRLKPVHIALGILGLVLFVVLFMPSPLVPVGG